PLGEDGRIGRIGLLRRNEMLPGSFEDTPHGKIPAVPRLRRDRFLPAGLAPLAYIGVRARLMAFVN
ncbi:MAG: hypothetical protein ACRD3V_19455, partial [Vicinamibacteria bacterium]